MNEAANDPRKVYLTPQEVANRLGVTVSAVGQWRRRRQGPPWTKVVGSVRYDLSDFEDWQRRNYHQAGEEVA